MCLLGRSLFSLFTGRKWSINTDHCGKHHFWDGFLTLRSISPMVWFVDFIAAYTLSQALDIFLRKQSSSSYRTKLVIQGVSAPKWRFFVSFVKVGLGLFKCCINCRFCAFACKWNSFKNQDFHFALKVTEDARICILYLILVWRNSKWKTLCELKQKQYFEGHFLRRRL